MARYGDNIRRIAGTDKLTDRIRQAESRLDILDKAAIPGGRAIAYPSGGTQSGSPGNTNPDKNGSPDQLDPQKKDPGDEAGKDGKTTDGKDILNGTKVLQPGEDPGKIALKDCETGEKIDMILNAGANEGESKFQHPAGWDINGNAGNQSGYDHWTLGKFWRGSSAYFSPSGTADGPTPETGYKAAIGYHNGTFDYDVTDARLGSGGVVYTDATHATVHAEYYLRWNTTPINNGWVVNDQAWSQMDCGAETGTARCIAAIPQAYSKWQQQDPTYHHQLAFSAKDGGFVSSSHDDGLPAKFRNDVGSGLGLNNVKLCTDEAVPKHVVVSALSDGTFAYFEEDGFGEPKEGAKVFHFDSAGKYKDLIRPDEYDYLKSTNNPAA